MPRVSRQGTCTVPGCFRKRCAKGLCRTHYKWRASGDPNWRRLIPPRRGYWFGSHKTSIAIRQDVYKRIQAYSGLVSQSVTEVLGRAIEAWVRDNLVGEASLDLGPDFHVEEPKHDDAIAKAYREGDLRPGEIAAEFGVTEREVFRALKRTGTPTKSDLTKS